MEIDFEEIQDESPPTPNDESSPNTDNPPQQTEEEGGEKVPSDWMTIFGPFDLGCPIRNDEGQRSRRYQRDKA